MRDGERQTGEQPATAGGRDWHLMLPAECLEALQTRFAGLASAEVEVRRAMYGPNELPQLPRPSPVLLFLRQFRSPLIYLLLAAAAVSVFLGHGDDAWFIGIVLLINAAIGAVQEHRAESSMASLRRLIQQVAHVRRDGSVLEIPARELVIGDIVEVETGVAITADLRLLSSRDLRANESSLTGESMPTAKDAEAMAVVSAGLGDRPTMLHAGTLVEEGRGVGVVVATGLATELGRISASMRAAPAAAPPLLQRLDRLARQIAIGTVGLIAVLALLLAQEGEPLASILLLAIALAVSAIPEGLPIAVTVALAAATRRMAARNVVIRTLPAVEGLGACTLIASDKTGTLTQNKLSVERILLPDGQSHDAALPNGPDCLALARAGAYCNEAVPGPEGAAGDSVDVALAAFAVSCGIDFVAAHEQARLAVLPYEPARRFAAALVQVEGARCLFVKGAPETVLPMCAQAPDSMTDAAETMATGGYRVLAIAARELAAGESSDCSTPDGLRLLGFVGLLDPIRPEAPAAIAHCIEAGIKVLMVTGDHPATALTIARQLGLDVRADQVITGKELRSLENDADALAAAVLRGRVFARIEPLQKLHIVEILSAAGELVAVTGDGVNDAPALQAAHIGVAMGRGGTDVARSASDLVLLDDNFASIVAGVEEGRITYANVRKIVIFLLATGVAEIFMFIGAVLTSLPLPLTPVQLLWSNLVTNGAQDVMLGFGRGEGDELRRPPRRASEPIVDASALALILPPAVVMSVMGLMMVKWGVSQGMPTWQIQNAVLLLTVLFQNAYALCLRSEQRPIHRVSLLSNPWLLIGVSLALALHLAAMHWSPLARIIGTAPVSTQVLSFCLAGAALTVIVTEVTKAAVRRRARSHPSRREAPSVA